MRHTVAIVMLVLGLTACERYTAPEIVDSEIPLFYVEGDVDGTSYRFDADQGYIATSNYEIDSFGVVSYVGTLSECATCSPVLRFKWRSNSQEDPSLLATVSETEPAWRLKSPASTREVYAVNLNALPSESTDSYQWLIDGVSYNTKNLEIEVERDDDRTFLPVELTADYSNGCQATIRDTIFLPNHGCNCRIASKSVSPEFFNYVAIKSANAGVNYNWFFESGATASSREVVYAYADIPSDGVESIRLATRVNSCEAVAHYQQHFSQVPSSCAINIDVDIAVRSETLPPAPQIDLNTFEVIYSDGGRSYTSFIEQQPASSTLSIEHVEQYIDPLESGDKPGVRVSGRFDCLLVNAQDTIRFTDVSFTLPLGQGADQ